MTCPVCESSKTQQIMVKESAEVYQCYDCTFVFAVMENIPIVKGGEAELERNDPSINTLRLARLNNPHTVLDFGCGHGIFIRFLREREIYSVGIDVDTEVTLDALRGETFDAITLVEVIEHLADPVGTVHTMVPLLRHGGILYIESSFTDTRKYRGEGDENIFEWWYLSPSKGHVSFFNQASMEVLATKCGLSFVEPRLSANVFRLTR